MELNTLMTANPACCSRDTPLRDVAKLMADNDCGMIPVVDQQGMPLGVITDRDIAIRAIAGGKDPAACSAGDYMSSPVRTVPMDTSLADCCAAMESAQVRRMPVVDRDGRICGVVAQADIALNGNASRTAEVVREVSRPG
jgi:CBS domain-containing protein